MIPNDLLLDFDLYQCERFDYRNSRHVTPTMNGFCVSVRIKPVKLYIRFWEYSNGVDGFPDWYIILVHCNFIQKQKEKLQELMQFFKEYAPRYGYEYISVDDYPQFNQMLEFQRIQSVGGQEKYIFPLNSV